MFHHDEVANLIQNYISQYPAVMADHPQGPFINYITPHNSLTSVMPLYPNPVPYALK